MKTKASCKKGCQLRQSSRMLLQCHTRAARWAAERGKAEIAESVLRFAPFFGEHVRPFAAPAALMWRLPPTSPVGSPMKTCRGWENVSGFEKTSISAHSLCPFTLPVRAILRGLKRCGMLVADNGIEWAISVTPDPRIPNLHEELRRFRGSDFEVVVAPETAGFKPRSNRRSKAATSRSLSFIAACGRRKRWLRSRGTRQSRSADRRFASANACTTGIWGRYRPPSRHPPR